LALVDRARLFLVTFHWFAGFLAVTDDLGCPRIKASVAPASPGSLKVAPRPEVVEQLPYQVLKPVRLKVFEMQRTDGARNCCHFSDLAQTETVAKLTALIFVREVFPLPRGLFAALSNRCVEQGTTMDFGKILGELRSGGWKIFAVLLLVALGIVIAATAYPATFHEPFPGLVAGAMFAALASAIVLLCYAVAFAVGKITDSARRRASSPSAKALQRRFGTLTPQQRQLLIQVFKSGQRRFDWGHDNFRWFEELGEIGFTEYIAPIIFYAGQPSTYKVTVEGWEAMERLNNAGTLA
jgi:hypothetical protein